MTTLNPSETHQLLSRFPQIELSYETTPHKKVPPSYNVCLGIPTGKKYFVWFSFFGSQNQCFLLELNKERKIGNIVRYDFPAIPPIFLGTLFYGTIYLSENSKSIFLIEDIFFYKGVPMKGLFFGEKLGFIERFFGEYLLENRVNCPFNIRLPTLWFPIGNCGEPYECIYDLPEKYLEYYPIHHIQYRSLADIVPYLNIFPTKKTIGTSLPLISNDLNISSMRPKYKADFHKPQYRLPTVFVVMADIAFDIYRLYAYGIAKELVFYEIAYITNYEMSVFMNSIFRNIKENMNLDYIEESDDEDDFENIEIDKYVDLKKTAFIECKFNGKFKKWMPVKIVDGSQKVVHIRNLVADYQGP